MERARSEQSDPGEQTLEPDRAAPERPGPGDSEGSVPEEDTPIREKEDLDESEE